MFLYFRAVHQELFFYVNKLLLVLLFVLGVINILSCFTLIVVIFPSGQGKCHNRFVLMVSHLVVAVIKPRLT
jgi:hypothetical protein